MRTNIDIDDVLMATALRVTGAKTKRDVVELALETLVRLQREGDVTRLFGQLNWEGDLDAMRTD